MVRPWPDQPRTGSAAYAQGCGVNIANKYPTKLVNDSIALHNKETGGHLSPLSIELVLARTLNQLEMYLGQYEATGMKAVEKQYYKYWLHRFVNGLC